MNSELYEIRSEFHNSLLNSILTVDANGVPTFADKDQNFSRTVSVAIVNKLGKPRIAKPLAGQTQGKIFEQTCAEFIERSFAKLLHIRPGRWSCCHVSSRSGGGIAEFDQYKHLQDLETLAEAHPQLATALGNDYTISPDVIVCRDPLNDNDINLKGRFVGDDVAKLTPLRRSNNPLSRILHASISCKWTLRSDRAQNARSEALNLLRNRKGRCPNIMAVTAEPTPSRISSLALGTGDIDCVYHFALYELTSSVEETGNDEAMQLLKIMIDGKRLKDISDLPLDLAI